MAASGPREGTTARAAVLDASPAGDRPRIGISACLLGEEVRFDGGHKRDPFLTEVLSPHVEWVRVCPEVEVGMGTPREPLHLVRDAAGRIRMITVRTGADYTAAMNAWARRRVKELAGENLDGYILKKSSPSCGMEGVNVFGRSGRPRRDGRGLFAAVLMARLPDLLVEEEGRLADARLRENFIERVFACHRLRRLFRRPWRREALIAFHAAHTMSLLSHSPAAYQALERLLASGVSGLRLQREYERGFMRALAILPTRRTHTNVLMRIAGQLKPVLDSGSRQEIVERIDEYRRGLVPLTAPITLLRHHARNHGIADLAGQSYFDPYPREILARHHV